MTELLIIDNYDSFTYNLVQHFGELGCAPVVRRNDQVTIAQIRELAPKRICISPGPGVPAEAGISNEILREMGSELPILGVCLGHQCMGEVFGGEVIRAPKPMHGKVSPVRHHGTGVFAGLENPFLATRYHSLIVRRASLPACLTITAESDDGEIMGLQHRELPLHGVQFHPESILTLAGKKLLANFLAL